MSISTLLCCPPPIHGHHLTRNITCPLRSQKQYCRSQLPRLTNPPHWYHSGHHSLRTIQNSLRHPRPEHSGRDGIYAYTSSCPFNCQCSCQIDYCCFTCIVANRL